MQRRNFSQGNLNLKKCKIEINSPNIIQMFILGVGLFILLGLWYTYAMYEICCLQYQLILSGLFFGECEKDKIPLLIILANLNFDSVAYFVLKFRKIISSAIFVILSFAYFL